MIRESHWVTHRLKPNNNPSHKYKDFRGKNHTLRSASLNWPCRCCCKTNKKQCYWNSACPWEPEMHFLRTQTVRLLPLLVSLAVISVSWVARAQHSAEVIRALLFTRSLGTNVIIWKRRVDSHQSQREVGDPAVAWNRL